MTGAQWLYFRSQGWLPFDERPSGYVETKAELDYYLNSGLYTNEPWQGKTMGGRGSDFYYITDPQWPVLDTNDTYETYTEHFVMNSQVILLWLGVYIMLVAITLFNYKYRFKVKQVPIAPALVSQPI